MEGATALARFSRDVGDRDERAAAGLAYALPGGMQGDGKAGMKPK